MSRAVVTGIGICVWGAVLIAGGVVGGLVSSWAYVIFSVVGAGVVAVGVSDLRRARPSRTGAPPVPPSSRDDIENPDLLGEAGSMSEAQAVQVLAQATWYAVPGVRVGVAAAPVPTSAAYFTLRAAGAAARPRIEYLVTHGSSPGRLYGGMLLHRLDPAAADRLWHSMLGDHTRIGVLTGGCTGIGTSTVGELAAAMLTGEVRPRR